MTMNGCILFAQMKQLLKVEGQLVITQERLSHMPTKTDLQSMLNNFLNWGIGILVACTAVLVAAVGVLLTVFSG